MSIHFACEDRISLYFLQCKTVAMPGNAHEFRVSNYKFRERDVKIIAMKLSAEGRFGWW